MRRFISLLLCVIIAALCGCQPTPEVEYVVNKGDNIAEKMINASALPTAAPKPSAGGEAQAPAETDDPFPSTDAAGQAVFPERWEDHIMTDPKEIIISADVITPETGSYPVQLVRKRNFTADDIYRIADYLLDDVKGWRKSTPSKEYLAQAIQYAATHDIPEFTEEWEKQDHLDWLNMEYGAASSVTEDITPCTEVFEIPLGGVTVYTESGGGFMYMTDEKIYVRDFLYGQVQPKSWWEYDYYGYKPEFDPEISLEEAVAKAEEFLADMGMEGYGLYLSEEARSQNIYTKEIYDMGWQLSYARSYGYVPYSVVKDSQPSVMLQFNSHFDKELMEFSGPLREELMRIYVTGSGIKEVAMYSSYEYIETVNENVQLMDFDTLTTRIKMLLTAAVNNPNQYYGYFVLEKMILTAIPQPKKDSSDYYYMPVWVCVFGWYFSVDGPLDSRYYTPGEQRIAGMPFTVSFNAIDGSRVALPEGVAYSW